MLLICTFAFAADDHQGSFNGDLESIVTLIKINCFAKLLKDSGYDKGESEFLLKGFKRGFDLQYDGPWDRQDYSNNIPFREVGDKWDMWSKLMKEVELGRVAGPFNEIPFENFVQSPIGLVPKSGGKTRLIFHLSYDFKTHKSINHYIPKELTSVRYPDLDHAVNNCLKLLDWFLRSWLWGGGN